MIVDFHHHFTPRELIGQDPGDKLILSYDETGAPSYTTHKLLYDMDARLAMMDASGIDVAMLSSASGMSANPELSRLANDTAKKAEKDHPKRFIGFAKVETDPVKGARKYLVVDVLLSSQPDTSYEGRLYRDEMAAEAVPNKNEHDENEPVVTAYVKLNVPGTDEATWVPRNHFVTGLEVRTRVRCGKHALGYTLFHGVWEWFYEKVVFFF